MDFDKELQRIGKIIDEMPMDEFEDMLLDSGLGKILPSEQSDYVKVII